MASAGASGTVTVEDQRSCTKIETLRGKTPTEIHSALQEVLGEQAVDRSTVRGEQTVDRSTVSRWATRFREGRVTINDNQMPGRPKTSTDERIVELVADFLAQDRRAT
jgi:transposase